MSRDSEKQTQETTSSRRWWEIGSEQDRVYWDGKYAAAIAFMESRQSISSILIEVAAQHPLIDGKYPNEEFSKRLLLAVKLYTQEIEAGNTVEIYVPGSVHMFEGKLDTLSLSKAGGDFLIQQGVPPHVIRGDDLNKKYKGEEGVYNSADECFVAAGHFKDGQFGHLYSVLSPVQLLRKTLHYLEFGVLPLNHTAPSLKMFHNYIGEIFEAIPYVLFADHSLQGADSIRSKELRRSRKPKTT
ncbi:MAG: hypothetical protein WCD76_04925 [Pyrinomonadaceae bacterium]